MPHVLILATSDPVGAGASRQVSALLASNATADTVTVGESSDLPAGVLRAGKVKPTYDAVIVVGKVERSLETFVYQVCEC